MALSDLHTAFERCHVTILVGALTGSISSAPPLALKSFAAHTKFLFIPVPEFNEPVMDVKSNVDVSFLSL